MNYFDLILEQDTLSRILTEEKIFEKYFGEPIDFYKSYKNPLRSDNNSGCNFFYGKKYLIFFDHSRGVDYNWVEFVKESYGFATYPETLRKVAEDFNLVSKTKKDYYKILGIPNPEKNQKKKKSMLKDIHPRITSFRDEHIDFWSTFDYTFKPEDFIKYRTLPFDFSIVEFEDFSHTIYQNPIGFVYYLTPDKKQKQLYRPFAEKSKKFRQFQQDNIFGLEYLEKGKGHVIITKSYKDYIILKIAGFNAICILAENYKIPMDLILNLSTYGKIYTLFDPDETGIKRSEQLEKTYRTTPLFLHVDVKDPYGHYKQYGLVNLTETVWQLMNTKENIYPMY